MIQSQRDITLAIIYIKCPEGSRQETPPAEARRIRRSPGAAEVAVPAGTPRNAPSERLGSIKGFILSLVGGAVGLVLALGGHRRWQTSRAAGRGDVYARPASGIWRR